MVGSPPSTGSSVDSSSAASEMASATSRGGGCNRSSCAYARHAAGAPADPGRTRDRSGGTDRVGRTPQLLRRGQRQGRRAPGVLFGSAEDFEGRVGAEPVLASDGVQYSPRGSGVVVPRVSLRTRTLPCSPPPGCSRSPRAIASSARRRPRRPRPPRAEASVEAFVSVQRRRESPRGEPRGDALGGEALRDDAPSPRSGSTAIRAYPVAVAATTTTGGGGSPSNATSSPRLGGADDVLRRRGGDDGGGVAFLWRRAAAVRVHLRDLLAHDAREPCA